METDHDTHYRRIEANGITFNVAECGRGERLALCLHGFPETSYSYRHQLPMLARLGYRAWAPDLRGFGASSRPRGIRRYAIDRLQDDVAALVDASGSKRVLLMGHDWGGGIAWAFAASQRRPLERLIILNMAHPMCFFKGLRSPRQLRRSWYMFFFQLPWLPELVLGARGAALIGQMIARSAVDRSRFPPEVTRVFQQAAAQPGALTAMLNYYRAMPLALRELGPAKRVIDTPTLMLWGEADLALGKELTFETHHYVRNLTLRYLPNVSHWVQQEAPETVNRMIEAWLADAPVPFA